MKLKDLVEATELSYEEKLKSEEYVVKMNIQDIVQIPEWQELRSYFVGKWKSQPEKNLQMLKDFAGDLKKLSNRRLRIIQNYVTGSAFRIGIIANEDIKEFTEAVRKEVADRKADGRWK
jgi:hypothetical protein